MNDKEQRLKEKLLAEYSDAVDEMLERCRDREDFGDLEDEVERLAQATLPSALSELAKSKDFSP